MSRPTVVTVCIWLLRNRGSFSNSHFRGTHVPVEEPSTASRPEEHREPHADAVDLIPAAPPCVGPPEKCSSASRQKWARVGGGSKSSSRAPAGADVPPCHVPRSIGRARPNKPHGSAERVQTMAAPSGHETSI